MSSAPDRLAAAVCLVLGSLCAVPASAAQDKEPAKAAASQPSNASKTICRTIGKTGSRLGGRRVCRTKAEWEQFSRAGSEEAKELTNSDSLPIPPG
jgi:hypothetical protein